MRTKKHTELLEMKLHEEKEIDTDTIILRVPGGWVYKIYASSGIDGWSVSSVFVPHVDIDRYLKD